MNHSLFTQSGFGLFWRRAITALGLLLMALFFTAGTASSHPHPIPTISITSVQRGANVTLQTYNYPPGQEFTVRMGKMGTRGVGGEVVGTLSSGAGGSMPASFDIPSALKDDYQIAIRLDSNLGFYSFNWFYNNTAPAAPIGGGSSPAYTGIPTFKITAVTEDEKVTITTHNFPANQTFYVTMGEMFTRGVNGIPVDDFDSGQGGTLEKTFDIPAELAGNNRISIRAQTAHTYPLNPYYAFNWFWNNDANTNNSTSTATSSSSSSSSTTATTPASIYYGIPTFTVCQVTRDGDVEILTKNFPTNQNFTVTMGPMYTQGIGGKDVATLESKDDRSARYEFSIPDNLKGSYRISIRTQTAHAYPFYSYNWFYNNTTTMDHCQ